MGRIPDHILNEVRSRADLIEVVGQCVTLTQRGREYWGLCPFHEEKSASFKVNPENQIFYCFGCHAHGSVFDFRMRHSGLEFPDAVRSLAREVGVTVPETGASKTDSGAAIPSSAASGTRACTEAMPPADAASSKISACSEKGFFRFG